MKKKTFLTLSIFIGALLLVFIGGCVDSSMLPDGYVEVDSLRIANSTIYLSPSGDTSYYQLDVEILPKNATNQNLSYYIPSKYLNYVTVNKEGLISAKLQPEEGTRIPLTVTSTSNKKAKLIVGLIIEYVEVKEIEFTQNDLEIFYNSESMQLKVKFEPYHAQDGRNIIYESNRPDIAQISATGLFTPLKTGNVTITATGKTMAGKEIKAYFHAKIVYKESKFKLEVDTSAKFKRTISNTKPIAFTLMSLEPDADPNPRIQWYVGPNHIFGRDGRMTYEHIPEVTTCQSYTVKVKVLCENEPEKVYESETIYIYEEFSGFDFLIGNESKVSENYLYGDEVTFDITSTGHGIEYFEWDLRRVGQRNGATTVGRTSGTNPDFTKTLNLDGDFILTAIGYDSLGQSVIDSGQTFRFNVTRYVTGDTIVITPNVLFNGIPPESYNFYLYKYEDGMLSENGILLRDGMPNVAIDGHTIYYRFKQDDKSIVILAKGMLDGVVATVITDGKKTEFTYSTPVINVCSTDFAELSGDNDIIDSSDVTVFDFAVKTIPEIYDIVIDGIYEVGCYTPVVYWSTVGKTASYWVEVTDDDGRVLLLNSSESNCFGDYYCKIPTDFVTLKDKFKIRIKQKGGQFDDYCYYGYTASAGSDKRRYFTIIDTALYKYLVGFTGMTDNGYIRTLKELGAILDYILLYEPESDKNSLVLVTKGASVTVEEGKVQQYDRKYAIKLYLETSFKDYENFYPINVDTLGLEEIYIDLYKSLIAVQNAYCETSDCRLKMLYDQSDGGYYIELYKNLNKNQLIKTSEMEAKNFESEHYSSAPYGKTNNIFPIIEKEPSNAYTSDQLYNIAEAGKQPIPQSDNVATIYNEAKNIINSIIGKGMTEKQKILAIYDWLILNVNYDRDVLNIIAADDFAGKAYDYEAFHLEGVFISSKAVCDGIAKAMSLLCRIEGIPCYKVSGYAKGSGHAWNKVYVDGAWYAIDATWGGVSGNDGNINYKFFLMTDEEFQNYYTFGGTKPKIYGEYQNAVTLYNYYALHYVNGHDLYIEDINQFVSLLNSFGEQMNNPVTLNIMLSENFRSSYDFNLQNILLQTKSEVTGKKYLDDNVVILSEDVIIVTLKPMD